MIDIDQERQVAELIETYPSQRINVAAEYALQDQVDGQIADDEAALAYRVLAYLESGMA